MYIKNFDDRNEANTLKFNKKEYISFMEIRILYASLTIPKSSSVMCLKIQS